MTRIKENKEEGKDIVSVWNVVGVKLFINYWWGVSEAKEFVYQERGSDKQHPVLHSQGAWEGTKVLGLGRNNDISSFTRVASAEC